MRRWEYLTVATGQDTWVDSLGRTGNLPSKGDPMYGDISDLLNELGEQGWELVGVASWTVFDIKLFLKRPKS